MVAHDALLAWENFYIIVGSSAGALTGLQFVVMALAAETEMNTDTGEVDAFGTPTIVHFCAVLLVSAILSMPWSRSRKPQSSPEYAERSGLAIP